MHCIFIFESKLDLYTPGGIFVLHAIVFDRVEIGTPGSDQKRLEIVLLRKIEAEKIVHDRKGAFLGEIQVVEVAAVTVGMPLDNDLVNMGLDTGITHQCTDILLKRLFELYFRLIFELGTPFVKKNIGSKPQ